MMQSVAVKRVAYFLTQFPAVSQPFVLNQIVGMLERGWSVSLYAPRYSSSGVVHGLVANYNLEERANYIADYPKSPVLRVGAVLKRIISNGSWRRFSVLGRALNVRRYGRDAASLRLLGRVAALEPESDYDIIHCQFGNLGPLVLRLQEIGAISGRLVVSIRGFDVTKYIQNRSSYYDELFQRADLFLPVSDSLEKRLVDLGCSSAKIHVLHSGIDCQKFMFRPRRLPQGEPMRVITIGRLVEKKGIRYGIEAVAAAIRAGVAIEYRIVGDGELRGELQRLIHELDVGHSVKLLGWQNHEAVVELLDQSHVLLAPSTTAVDGDQEGIPNVVKEAMAMGLPVLSTVHAGIPELVDDGVSGFLVSERDAAQLADRLEHLATHSERWAAMGQAGRARVECEYDNSRLNDELELLYRRVIDAAVGDVNR